MRGLSTPTARRTGEAGFAAAWAEGKTLPIVEIVAEALEEAPAAVGLIVAADTARELRDHPVPPCGDDRVASFHYR